MTNKRLCKGLYLETCFFDKELKKIVIKDFPEIMHNKEEVDFYPYDDASVFLKGSCQLFALALNGKFGYDMYEIVQNNRTIHVFCVINVNDNKAYVDVRGITTDFCDFNLETFLDDSKEFSIVKYMDEEDKKLQGDKDELGLEFAKAIISRYPNYYSI